MGQSSQPTTTTQIQKVDLPPWVDQGSQENYEFAKLVGNRDFQQYTGPRVAGQTNLERDAVGLLTGGDARSLASFNEAGNAFRAAAEYRPQTVVGSNVAMPTAARDVAAFDPAAAVRGPDAVKDVRAMSFLDRNIDAYMNPFTDKVVNTTLTGMDRGIATARQSGADAARGSGAWGGSRFGVSDAVLQSEGIRNKAATEAGLRSAAYTDAAGRIMTDNDAALRAGMSNQQKDITGNAQRISVDQGNQASTNTNNALNAGIAQGNQSSFLQTQAQQLQAGLANQANALDVSKTNAANGLAGAQLGLAAGSGFAGLSESAINTAGKTSLLASQLGANERAVNQAGIDAAREGWQEGWDYPTQQLNLRLAALGMSPYGKTTTGTTTQTGGTSSNGLMQGIGAVASFLPLMFSDREVKKDVKRVGKVPGTDLNAYEFRYKKSFLQSQNGSKDDGAKQIGLMAQDVEKKVPGAVQKVRVGDKAVRAVNYPMAVAGARDPRDDKGRKRGPYKPRSFLAKAA